MRRLLASYGGVKLMLISGANSFGKTIRKKNYTPGQKGAKMLKNGGYAG